VTRTLAVAGKQKGGVKITTTMEKA
jgi:hypothetical protein